MTNPLHRRTFLVFFWGLLGVPLSGLLKNKPRPPKHPKPPRDPIYCILEDENGECVFPPKRKKPKDKK